MTQNIRQENDPMIIAFFACDTCRTVYAGKVGECSACGAENPDMTRVVLPGERTGGGAE